MSEFINNQSKQRQEQLKSIIRKIHEGMPLEEAKQLFKRQFDSVTTDEIVALEHALIADGMAVSEVQRLCDVHAAVFNGSISDIHKADDVTGVPGHPAYVFVQENRALKQLIASDIRPHLGKTDRTSHLMLRIATDRLMELSKHYARKESLFFPALEKRGITSIPKVMWGVDNDIRAMIKAIKQELDHPEVDLDDVATDIRLVLNKIEDMIVKEDDILMPMLADTLSLYDWILADEGSDEIGYFLEAPKVRWAQRGEESNQTEEEPLDGEIRFDAGTLSTQEANAIFNTVPFDMTFVDKDGHVKYFTQGKERIFDRPKTILGRHVNMCHPPQSVHVVEAIVERFQSGASDHEDFWIAFGDKFVHIRYYAVRAGDGSFLGTLEVTQDIAPLRALTGEKRLLDQ